MANYAEPVVRMTMRTHHDSVNSDVLRDDEPEQYEAAIDKTSRIEFDFSGLKILVITLIFFQS